MSGKLAGQIMQTGFLKGVRADVLITLASVADKHGQSWYSYNAIAHMSRRSRKAVIDAVRWLELRELITVARGRRLKSISGHHVGPSNIYTLNLAFFDALVRITDGVRKAMFGFGEEKWAAVKRASDWAEMQVEIFAWRAVVEVGEKPTLFIKQCLYGVGADRVENDRTQ